MYPGTKFLAVFCFFKLVVQTTVGTRKEQEEHKCFKHTTHAQEERRA